MVTRKTQIGWMALGGLVCLLAVVLACTLRDGNRAVAQGELVAGPPNPEPKNDKQTSKPKSEKKDEKSDVKAPASQNGLPAFGVVGFEPRQVPASTDKDKPRKTEVPPSSFDPSKADSGMKKPSPAPAKEASPSGWNTVPPSGSSPPISDKLSEPSPFPPSPAGSVGTADVGKNPSPPPPPAPSGPDKMPDPGLKNSSLPLSGSPMGPPPAEPTGAVKLAPPITEKPADMGTGSGLVPVSASSVEAPPPPVRSAVGEPPLAPPPGPVQTYQVADKGETMREIARRTLGTAERWADIHKLNPDLKDEETLKGGTSVRLPADACIPGEEADAVKPLPALRPKTAPARAKVLLPLTGTFQANLDDKKTMTLPRALRDQLTGSDTLLVSPGPDRCLWLTNQAHLDRLAQRLEQSPARESDVRVFKRLYFAQTQKQKLTAGRVAIPERLAQFAGLHQEVVVVGIDDHFEVWDAARWRAYTQEKSAAARE